MVGSSFLDLLRRNRATKARSRGRPIPVTLDTANTGVMRSEAMLSAAASTYPHRQQQNSHSRTSVIISEDVDIDRKKDVQEVAHLSHPRHDQRHPSSHRAQQRRLPLPNKRAGRGACTCLVHVLDGVRHLLVLPKVLRQRLPGLLEDRRRADVNLRHHHSDGNLRRSCVCRGSIKAATDAERGCGPPEARQAQDGEARGVSTVPGEMDTA